MVYDKTIIRGKLEIPPTDSPSGMGVQLGVVKRMLAKKAMLEKEYLDDYRDTVFDGYSEWFVSSNKSARYVEKIGSSRKALWECIKRLKTERNRLDTEVELVLSFGRKKANSDEQTGFDYSSDYSEKILSKEQCERSPEKFDDRLSATKQREGKIAEKFILWLYTSEKSPAFRGFTFKHSVALQKAFSVLKVNRKYTWDVYICNDKYLDTWPSVKFLTIPAFNALPIPEYDKAITRDKFLPENGIWPYRQIDPQNSAAGVGGVVIIADTLPFLGKAMEASSQIMSDGFVAAAALQASRPRSDKKSGTKTRVVFTKLSKADDDHKTKFETMLETYLDEDMPMGNIFEKMWRTDTSPVFSDNGTRKRDEGKNARIQDVRFKRSMPGGETVHTANIRGGKNREHGEPCQQFVGGGQNRVCGKGEEQSNSPAVVLVEVALKTN